MTLDNKAVAFITGASSGIGRALALELAGRSLRVAIAARREDRLAELAEEIGRLGGTALVLPCDVTQRDEFEHGVERCIETFGRLDILVNNAGRGHFDYIEETPDERIESIFALNVFALWYGTSVALRVMRSQGSGLIVNIASMAGKIGYPANAAYVAAKHATVGFTRALRAELVGSGVDAMVVVPGGVATDWVCSVEGEGSMLDLFANEREYAPEIARSLGVDPWPPLPLLTAEEVARTIVEAFSNPPPELHTHAGGRELALAWEEDQRAAERRMEPLWLAGRR